MSAAKEGLTAQDLKILESYAVADNRELYFNYLAHKAGNDGYPLLALGVVRNDNAPGATANRTRESSRPPAAFARRNKPAREPALRPSNRVQRGIETLPTC